MFPGGPPSKYYPGPTMLNFRDLTRTGVFIEVWSYIPGYRLSNSSTILGDQVLTMYIFLEKFFIAFLGSTNFFIFLFFFSSNVSFKSVVDQPPPGIGTGHHQAFSSDHGIITHSFFPNVGLSSPKNARPRD